MPPGNYCKLSKTIFILDESVSLVVMSKKKHNDILFVLATKPMHKCLKKHSTYTSVIFRSRDKHILKCK